ncbi:MAG: 1-acyl-sn-glycerol-3-phosphate acyltransferase [Bdellovibrionota bacterium]
MQPGQRNKLPPSATLPQRLLYPVIRDFFFFCFAYLAYAPIRRVKKPDLSGRFLWACSHSNFMCDAIPAGYEGPIPTKFLGKSTLFVFPIKRFVEFCGGLPLARAGDVKGMTKEDRSAQNRATFKVAIAAIKDGWTVAIYPEGVSLVTPGLTLPLKPGAAKLALSAEETHGFTLDLRIVPVGLEYGSRTKVGSGLYIRYGKPLWMKDYRELYERDPDLAIKQVTDDLTREMVGAFPHFTDDGKLALGKKLVAIGICRSKFDAAQIFLRQLENPAFWTGLEHRLRAFDEANKDHGIPMPAWGHRNAWKQLGPKRRPWRVLYLLLGFPLFLIDLPNNSLPEFFLSSAVEFFATDETERMSIRFILSPVILGIAFTLQFWFLKTWAFPGLLGRQGIAACVSYCAFSCVLWYFAVHWRRQCKRLSSLFFFRRAGVTGRSEAVARYRELRQYLGQF